MKLSIVIPMYNEQMRIPGMLDDITSYHRSRPDVVGEVVLVDDGSKDATVERAMWWMEKLPLRIERLPKNMGKWTAIRKGIEVAKNDAVLIMDADGSASLYEWEKVPKWCIERKRAVFGSRFMKESVVEGKSFLRSMVSKGYRSYVRFWYWYATGRRDVDDMQCPWKLIFKSKMVDRLSAKRFAGDIDLACALPEGVVSMPIRFIHMRGSKVKTQTMWEMAMETKELAKGWRLIYKERMKR